MQATLVAGETLNYTATLADYPANDGWLLRLLMNPRAGGVVITVQGTADGVKHLVQAASVTTSAWVPGDYAIELWAIKGAEQYRIDSGQLRIEPSLLAAAAGLDTRSQAEKDLEAVDAMLRGKAGSDVQAYTIAGRSLSRYPLPDLIKLRDRLRADVASERAAQKLAAGLGGRRRFVVRL